VRLELDQLSLPALGLDPEAATTLPEGLRRQVARFLLRWEPLGAPAAAALALLPETDRGPRDAYDRCRALVAGGELEGAQSLSRELVNRAGSGPWGQRAVGEVLLAMGRPHRADERFRAGGDPIGRARAHLALEEPDSALAFLREIGSDDPQAAAVRLAVLEHPAAAEAERELRGLLAEELRELRESLGAGQEQGPLPTNSAELEAALGRLFGHTSLRPGQAEMILPLLGGRSVLGLMPTGAGKSLCFQLPAALLPGATLVISPLIALMKDQIEGLPPALYRRATLINSALEPGEADRRLAAVARGAYSLIYAAPERMRQPSFVRALRARGISLFVVDEAHCVSLWGHDFRPDYLFIRQVLADLGRPTVLALTATATPEMQADIGRQLETEFHVVNLGTYRPNLRLGSRLLANEAGKWAALLELLGQQRGPAIVYVDRRRLAEELSERLNEAGIPAEAYHAGLDRVARDRAQNRFMLGETRVIAATVAFGMGVDKADVRLVVHYNLPRSLEAYYQEAGRAGRDGLPARCELVFTAYDRANLTRRTRQDRMAVQAVLSLHRLLERHLQTHPGPLPAEKLEQLSGMEPTRARVAISLLERAGAIERGYDLPAALWLAGTAGTAAHPEARAAAAALGLEGLSGQVIPAGRVVRTLGISWEEVEPRLLQWQEEGALRCRGQSRGLGLKVRPESVSKGLAAELDRTTEQLSLLDSRRLEVLAAYLGASECRQAAVSRYFGVSLAAACGACDNCLRGAGQPAGRLADERRAYPGSAGADELTDPEQSALFERLRAWRRQRALDEGVPAYTILSNRALLSVARFRPKTYPALAEVPGIGPAKLREFGQEILDLVRHST
jgi:ATP-dependent DNA helicase RecQ